MRWNTVLFDLDGTLTDPGVGITKAVQYALRHYGIDVPDRRKLEKFIGPPLHLAFTEYYGFAPDFPPEVRCGVGAESQGSLKHEEK